jgi:flagellar export protein FliJ
MPPKEKYRLQTVMNMRERARADAAQTVAASRERLDAAEAELARRERAVEVCARQQTESSEQMMMQINNGAEAREIINYRTHLADLRTRETFLRAEAAAQTETVNNARRELETALERLKLAAKEFKVIETHRENWRETRRRASAKKDQKLTDEIGAILHNKKS